MATGVNRARADEAVEQIRRALAEKPPTDAKERVWHKLEADIVCAVLIGMADLMDEGADQPEVAAWILEALSAGLGTFVLTEAQGDRAQATKLAKAMIRGMKDRTIHRVGDRGSDLIIGGLKDTPPHGRA